MLYLDRISFNKQLQLSNDSLGCHLILDIPDNKKFIFVYDSIKNEGLISMLASEVTIVKIYNIDKLNNPKYQDLFKKGWKQEIVDSHILKNELHWIVKDPMDLHFYYAIDESILNDLSINGKAGYLSAAKNNCHYSALYDRMKDSQYSVIMTSKIK